MLVSEEVERALAKLGSTRLVGNSGRFSPKQLEALDGRNLQLHFVGGKVEGEQGAAIHIVLIYSNTGQLVAVGLESYAKPDIIVLEGDFKEEADADWSIEDFESHVVREREGKRPLLTGDVQVTLKEGLGTLGEWTFIDNSS